MLKWIALICAAPCGAGRRRSQSRHRLSSIGSNIAATTGFLSRAPGEYANPILPGFYPDPSIVRVGADIYLVNSTFAWFPGIPIFHSRDLVRLDADRQCDRPAGAARLRPTGPVARRFRAGRSATTTARSTSSTPASIAAAISSSPRSDPAGPWSEPGVAARRRGGIDPSLFFDDDGSAWIVNNGPPPEKPTLSAAHRAIWLQQFDPKTLARLRPAPSAGRRRRRIPQQADLDRRAAHLQEGRQVLSDLPPRAAPSENHSRGGLPQPTRSTGPYVPARRAIRSSRSATCRASGRIPVTSTGHAKFVQTPDGRMVGRVPRRSALRAAAISTIRAARPS